MVSTNQYPMDSFPVKKGGNSSAVVSELRASRKIDDEEILAHFGKRQQFKVSCRGNDLKGKLTGTRGILDWCQF
jgi:hypothetical protein